MLSAAAPTAEREQSPACRLDEYRKGIRHSSDERLLPVSWWRAKNLVVGEPGKERKQFESSQMHSYRRQSEMLDHPHTKPLSTYLIKLARLGGYLARAHDPPPGNILIWRGLSRPTDIELGIMIGIQLVGN